MNKNRLLQSWHIGCTLLAALFIASCSQDELDGTQGEPLPTDQYPLELTASGLEAVATPAQASTRGTFFEGDWEGVTGVNVRVNGQVENVKEYTVTPESPQDYKTVTLTPAEPLTTADADKDFWWTKADEQKTVLAWAPSDIELNTKFTLPDEWTEEEFVEHDIIGATETIGFKDTDKSLEFHHLMAKVVVNLRYSEFLEQATTGKIKVKLKKSWTNGKLVTNGNDQLTISKSDETTTDMTLYFISQDFRYEEVEDWENAKPFASYTALVLPSEVRYNYNEAMLEVEVDGTTYTLASQNMNDYDIMKDGYEVRYTAGQVTTFNVTVKKKGLNYATVEYSMKWDENGATGDGSVAIP